MFGAHRRRGLRRDAAERERGERRGNEDRRNRRSATASTALPELLLQLLGHDGVNERADVAAELGDLADQARRDERVMLGRREEHRLDAVDQMAIHHRELKLVLEVRDGAQAADDRLEAVGAREIDGEPGVARDRNLGQVAQHLFRERDTLVEREQRRLLRVRGDRDDDPVEQSHATPDEVLVAASDRVEGAGIHGADFHGECASLEDCRGIVASSNRRSPYSTAPA